MPTFGLKPKKTQNLNAPLAWLTSKLVRDANTTSNDEREFIYEPPADQFIFTKNDRDEWVCIGGPSGYFFPSPLEIAEEEAKTAKQLNKTMRTELLKHSRIAEQRSHDLDEAKAEIGRLRRRIQRLEGELEKSRNRAQGMDKSDASNSKELGVEPAHNISAVQTEQSTC